METEIVLGPLEAFLDGSVQAGDAGQFFQGITAAQMAREQDRSFGSLRGRRMGTPLARHTGHSTSANTGPVGELLAVADRQVVLFAKLRPDGLESFRGPPPAVLIGLQGDPQTRR